MFEDEENDKTNYKTLPIFLKGREISDVANRIGDLIPEDDLHLQDIKGRMMVDAAQLYIKVAGAESGGLYDIKIEAASIIRKSAHDLILSYHSLKMFGFKEVEYFNIVRDLVEEYRLLFIDWVAGFDKWNYCTDRWGLFNPPGVGPFDKDPDDDIPFDGNLFDGLD